MNRIIIVSAIFLSLGFPNFAMSQLGAHVILKGSPHPRILVAPLSTNIGANLFVGELASLRPVFFTFANGTDQPIVAIAVTWTLKDSEGKQLLMKFTCDSYLSTRFRPVLPPGRRLVIGPRTWVADDVLEQYAASKPFAVEREWLRRAAMKFENASEVQVDIDLVIFADGTIYGPNNQLFSREIIERKLAANIVVNAANIAASEGRTIEARLTALLAGPRPENDLRALWVRRFARQVLRSDAPEAVLTYLKNLPDVPLFRP